MTSGSLSLRIIVVLIGGFVLLQLLLWAILSLPGRGDERRPFNLPRPAQVRVMAETIDDAPPARRAALLQAFNGSLYTVRIAAGPPGRADREGLDALRDRYAAALPGRQVTLSGRRPLLGRMVGDRPLTARFLAPIRLSISLRSGGVLAIDSRPSALVRAYLRQRAFLGVAGGLVLLLVLAVAARRLTRPLVRLSEGVRHFSSRLDTPDLPLEGSREMRDLAAAFNEMKGRIGGLMAERTRMLAGIAHDMRTYLTRLRLRAEFIDDPDQRARAARDLDEMSALLDDTLLFARHEADRAPPPVPIDLGRELESIADLRREMGHPVEVAPVSPGLAVAAVPIAFHRILANLIDNGLRHGGRVAVSAARREGRVEIAVADAGPGVPAEALALLGEPFGRLDASRDRSTGGAGLGLAIVRALAERDGAAVAFANRAGGGFVATVSYPAVPQPELDASPDLA